MRLIDDEGSMLGVMSLQEALSHAKNRSLDLVEMSANSNPPTCKVMDYGKWKFENKKKEKQNRKKQVKVLIKELQLRPRTDENDINIKLQKAREFLDQGHKVKINILFSGREMAHKELGFKLLQKVEKKISDMAFIEMPAKMERRSLFTIFAANTSGTSAPSATLTSQVNAEVKKAEVKKVEVAKIAKVKKDEIEKARAAKAEARKAGAKKAGSKRVEVAKVKKVEVTKIAKVKKIEVAKAEVADEKSKA